ncbi:hypothetical protein PLICRDRAFT_116115, partial [Plicaturopsis crispa FD-325 SS-3]
MLTGRRTKLKFDDYTSFWTAIINGIGQGDPISMIIFLFFNADILDIVHSKDEDATAFVDDTAIIAIGTTFRD